MAFGGINPAFQVKGEDGQLSSPAAVPAVTWQACDALESAWEAAGNGAAARADAMLADHVGWRAP